MRKGERKLCVIILMMKKGTFRKVEKILEKRKESYP